MRYTELRAEEKLRQDEEFQDIVGRARRMAQHPLPGIRRIGKNMLYLAARAKHWAVKVDELTGDC